MIYDHIVKVNGEYYPAGSVVKDNLKKEIEELPFSDTDIMLETEPVKRGRPKKN